MDSIWTVLGLEATKDISAIKRAYAQKTRDCHPEEDPEGFLQLRKAYQAAMDYAEGTGDISPENQEPIPEADGGEAEDEGWSLSDKPVVWDEGPNPFADHEAAHQFLNLYTGKQRKNASLWLDYFTSDAFLDVAWERRFAGLLLEETLRPPKIPVELLVNLPDAVYATPDFNVMCRLKDVPLSWSSPTQLLGEAVTSEALEELFSRFEDNQLNRLELSWNIAPPAGEELDYDARRSLVLLKDARKYACL